MANAKTKPNLNDLVHLNSYTIIEKIATKQFIRINFTLELPQLRNRSSYELVEIYGKREKIGQQFLLDKMNIKGYSIQKGSVYFIKEIAAKLMVSSIKWNYDPSSAKKGSHSLSISDFY